MSQKRKSAKSMLLSCCYIFLIFKKFTLQCKSTLKVLFFHRRRRCVPQVRGLRYVIFKMLSTGAVTTKKVLSVDRKRGGGVVQTVYDCLLLSFKIQNKIQTFNRKRKLKNKGLNLMTLIGVQVAFTYPQPNLRDTLTRHLSAKQDFMGKISIFLYIIKQSGSCN